MRFFSRLFLGSSENGRTRKQPRRGNRPQPRYHRCLLEPLEKRDLLSVVYWMPGVANGNWNVVNNPPNSWPNWSVGTPPGNNWRVPLATDNVAFDDTAGWTSPPPHPALVSTTVTQVASDPTHNSINSLEVDKAARSVTLNIAGDLTITGQDPTYSSGLTVYSGTFTLDSSNHTVSISQAVTIGKSDVNSTVMAINGSAGTGPAVFNPDSSVGIGTAANTTGGTFAASVRLTDTIWTGFGDITITGPKASSESRLFVDSPSFVQPNVVVKYRGFAEGTGTFENNLTVQGGTVVPGNTPNGTSKGDQDAIGTMNVDGIYSQVAGSTLQVNIASATSNSKLNVAGNATIAGKLDIRLLNGFAITTPQQFTIVHSAGTITNNLTGVNGTPCGHNLVWMLDLSPDAHSLYLDAVKVSSALSLPLNFTSSAAPTSSSMVGLIKSLDSNLMSSVTAIVTWGDGSSTSLANSQLTANGDSELDAYASNTYYTDGITCRFPIDTTFYTDDTYSTAIATVDSLAQVNSPAVTSLAFAGAPIYATQNVPVSAALASFDYPTPSNGQLMTATVSWDGSTATPALIEYEIGYYDVFAYQQHTYSATGTYSVTITVTTTDGTSYSTSGEIVVEGSDTPAPGSPTLPSDLTAVSGLTATLDSPFSGPVGDGDYLGSLIATFTPSSSLWYLATVQWETTGDATNETTAEVRRIGDTDTVGIYGDYTYLTAGEKSAIVTLTTDGVASSPITVPINVSDTVTVTPLPVDLDSMNEGDFVEVATVTDSDPAAVASAVSADYTASMTGLDTSSVVVVPDISGGFDVYAQLAAPYTGSTSAVTTTIARTDDASSASDTETNTLLVDSDFYLALDSITVTGDINVDGTLAVQADSNLGASSSTLTLNDGAVLSALDDLALGAGRTLNIADGATATIDTEGRTVLIAGALTGGSDTSIDVVGGGRVLFANTTGFSGTIGSSDGTSYGTSPVIYTSDTTVSTGSTLNAEDVVVLGCTLTVNGSSSPASMTVIGGTLAGSGTVSGQLALQDATLTKPVGASSAILVDGDNVDSSATINIDLPDTDLEASGTLSCIVTGLAAPQVDGSLTLTGNNTFVGTVIVGAGQTLYITSAAALGDAGNGIILNGTLSISDADVILPNSITVGSSWTAEIDMSVNVEIDGLLIGDSSSMLTVSGSGIFGNTFTLTNSGNASTWSGTMTCEGLEMIVAGGSTTGWAPELGSGATYEFTDWHGIRANRTVSIGNVIIMAPGYVGDTYDMMIIDTSGGGILADYCLTGGGLFITGGNTLELGAGNPYLDGYNFVDSGTTFQVDDLSFLNGDNTVEVAGLMNIYSVASYTDPSSVSHTLTGPLALTAPGTYTFSTGLQVTVDDGGTLNLYTYAV